MTFPCLICGEVPVIDQVVASSYGSAPGARATSSPCGTNNTSAANPTAKKGIGSTATGTTIRTLSKEVSDKIFQNLCRHLGIKTEPYWFIQNPGEHMPLCATCSAVVLEVYTLQSKVEQFQSLIKKQVWKLERMVADTEIASNWMATREEQENEEAMWNTLPCPVLAIRIARERHHKFRLQILQNFKNKVKLRQKMRAAGQLPDDMLFDVDLPFTAGEATMEDTDRVSGKKSQGPQESPVKRPKWDDNLSLRPQSNSATVSASRFGSSVPHASTTKSVQSTATLTIPSSISISAVPSQNQDFVDESEMSDDQESQTYSDVQIVCSVGPVDILKDEQDFSGDGEESMLDQDGNYWSTVDDENMDDYDAGTVSIPEGVEVVWVAPDVPLRKDFLDNLINENLKPSVFLRKLIFAVFGVKQVANSSGISGSCKPGAKPSLNRLKFEALREYTIDTYGIRDNQGEQEDLNRKIRTICCDARKAIKRRSMKPTKQESFQCNSNGASANSSEQMHGGGAIVRNIVGNHDPGEFGVDELLDREGVDNIGENL